MPFLHVDIFDDLPKRLKSSVNPFSQRLIEGQESQTLPLLFGSSLRNMQGRWREYFSEKMGRPVEKLVLEIGVHKGKVLQALAQDNPQTAFVGMDITMKRVVLSAEALENVGLKNGQVVLGNAKFLEQLFAEGELDGVLIFFPDPWSKKKRQLNKRLMDEAFCKQVCSVLKEDGFFWLKTDSQDYFENTLGYFENLGFVRAGSKPFEKAYESTFEQRFKSRFQQTFEETMRKPSH